MPEWFYFSQKAPCATGLRATETIRYVFFFVRIDLVMFGMFEASPISLLKAGQLQRKDTLAETMLADLRARAARVCWRKCTGRTTKKNSCIFLEALS